MARIPGNQFLQTVRDFLNTEKTFNRIQSASRKPAKPIRKFVGLDRHNRATEEFKNRRKRGLSLNGFLRAVPPKIRSNAVRDNVTIKTLKMNRDKTIIRSMSLTYDKTSGRMQIRPHKHEIHIIPLSGEVYNVSFSKAKGLKFFCDCEFWTFDCEYSMATRYGATDIRYSNGEFPIQKNPSLEPVACKHCYVLMSLVKQKGL